MTLYELTNDYKKLLTSGLDADDEQCFMDTLKGVMGEVEAKADDYAYVLSEFDARIKAIDAEMARLKERKTVIANSTKRMKERLYEAMTAMGKREIVTDLHTFKIQKNGGKQVMEIFGEVPDKWQKVIYEPDNDRIRAALESGETLPFAKLKERGEHVRIK